MTYPTPYYVLNDLINACGVRRSVYVWNCALATAKNELNLPSMNRVLDFIAQGGVESPYLANSVHLNNQPTIMVDSYNFYSGTTYCYLAFFYQPASQQWNIKSLKRNTSVSPRTFVFAAALKKAGVVK